MPQDINGSADKQNIDEVLELLKQSYGQNGESDAAPVDHASKGEGDLSEAELREKLRMQFISDEDVSSEEQEDFYYIDEDFLKEAEVSDEPDKSEEYVESEESEEPEEFEELKELEEFDEAEEPEFSEDVVYQEDFFDINDDDDGFTFDDIEEQSDESDVTYTPLVLEDNGGDNLEDNNSSILENETEVEFLDDDVTFEDLETFEEQGDELVLTRLEIEPEESDLVTTIERATPDYFKNESANSGVAYVGISTDNYELEKPEVDQEEPEAPAEEKAEDFLSEFFSQEIDSADVAESPILDSLAKNTEAPIKDDAELSLLMQFGCEEDVLSKYSMAEAHDEIYEENEESQLRKDEYVLCEQVRMQYGEYSKQRGSILLRLILSGFSAFLLLLCEALPLMGAELPGIMNRDDYFISYVLIGMQLMILCALPSYKHIWDGAKRMFTKKPTPYSITVVLAAIILVYDITIMFVESAVMPPVFHFVFACTLVLLTLSECITVTTEMKSFEFFFADILNGVTEHSTEKKAGQFTLCRSNGKNSTAEKMYMGGLDDSKNVYFPLEIKSAQYVLEALNKKSKKADIAMAMFIPSIALSVLMGMVSLIVSGTFWIGVCTLLLSLFFTLPVIGLISSCLPFAVMNKNAISSGYAYAGEKSMEEYSNCDILIFEDLHLFKKASAANINLALYDATDKSVLLACLDAVYSQIGGPMGEAFSSNGGRHFENCRITRIAKSGIEALVENNYSVLIGSESFMSRYGISFPNVSLNDDKDRIFTLCVSVNGRATARIAVRYMINEMFEMFSQRLKEDGISCAIETFDPMISTELLSRILPKGHVPMSIVHLNVLNLKERNNKIKDALLFDVGEKELGVVAHNSRLNLAVALSAAKRMKKLRLRSNLIAIGMCGIGAIIAFLTIVLNSTQTINEFSIILYWILGLGGLSALCAYEWSLKNRYSYEKYLFQKQQKKLQSERQK